MQKIGCDKSNINAAHVIVMCDYFGVSYKAMLFRIDKILGLGKEKFDCLSNIQPLKTAKDYSLCTEVFEKPKVSEKIIGDYSSKAQTLYESGLISEGHLIELLNCIKPGVDE